MHKTSLVRARMEPTLKEEVEGILLRLGLTVSETIHLLYRQIKLRRGLPFEVRIPNRLTAKTLTESKGGKNVKRFTAKEDLYRDLGL
ncbi:MAG: type II toxin-antitoxin system RelB/DinJ family antitoxin [Chlamydiae bacterium]|nr:type II toxin-antitoxin system RelB/DinJ family antitoxin [Chlamydiota bacterium]MBI3276868.1 type II toxin-antitoxin system RelB/DinJ family antitoxin [Chlamydiota bacterium]